MITTDQVKELRDKTGISVMQCKKALEEAGGDMEKALLLLKKKGADIASKKGDRELGAGAVSSYIHSNGSIGAMVLLLSETDFVSKNKEFIDLARDIAMHVSATNPEFLNREEVDEKTLANIKELLAKEVEGKPAELQDKILQGKIDAYFKEKILLEQSFIKNEDQTIADLISNAVQKFGEKIVIGKFVRFSAAER
ncbi:MAG: elongation factor Ts, partial [Candidatus Paceibacterota bacterium]|jgi:elongation factor Ts